MSAKLEHLLERQIRQFDEHFGLFTKDGEKRESINAIYYKSRLEVETNYLKLLESKLNENPDDEDLKDWIDFTKKFIEHIAYTLNTNNFWKAGKKY